MRFDEAEYRDGFLKKHRGARGAPGDLMARYAITLPAVLGSSGLRVRVYQYGSGPARAAQRGI